MAGIHDVANELYKATSIKLTQSEAAEITETLFKALKKTIIEDGNVIVRDFGTFTHKRKESRQGRNPSNGETITIPAKNVITFKARPLPPIKEKKAETAKKAVPAKKVVKKKK